MISRQEIQDFVNHVVRRFKPDKVILFGSYASGRPTADSDVDLMVVMRHRGRSSDLATKIRLACPRTFPMDLIVRSPFKLREQAKDGDQFATEITSRGIVLHEGDNARSD
jgi:predicted nucleotidyltransferase